MRTKLSKIGLTHFEVLYISADYNHCHNIGRTDIDNNEYLEYKLKLHDINTI